MRGIGDKAEERESGVGAINAIVLRFEVWAPNVWRRSSMWTR